MELLIFIFIFPAILLLSLLIWYAFSKVSKVSLHAAKPHHAKRHEKNPILSPQSWNDWESEATFNPAVLQDKKGLIHLLYRAIGADGVSRIGYAASKDGKHFDERLSYPVFAMQKPRINVPETSKKYDPVMYASGGSWGGTEDPRLVEIGDKIYMTFNTFDGWDFIRVTVTSIKTEDFYNKRWRWSRPLFISPRGQVNKNWLIFPEKIHGKFAVLHSITPDIQVDYVNRLEDLDMGTEVIKSRFSQKASREGWDNWVRGAGPPPIKTEKGWLVLYHAMDKKNPQIGYKLGALLLDLGDPRKIIARSPAPILTPNEWYENDWKPGVVYACGATIKDDMLYVYYGGGDKHVCMAHTPVRELLEWLEKYGKVK